MGTMTKKQELKIIADAIRLTERFYPEKVVIEKNENGLKIYSPSGSTFMNTDIISAVNAMKANNHIVYNEALDKVVLTIF